MPVSKLRGAQWEAARNQGYYKTKVKVNGQWYWRRVMPFEGVYADRLNLRNSNRLTRAEFFGGGRPPNPNDPNDLGGIGWRRERYFSAQLKARPKDDPADILVEMLTGPTNAKKFIPIP